ncbi:MULTISPECIES: Gfo/Idh/MocA family protein [Halocynthiibacter]|uniref:Gfo/Idh/MocA family oxidoreductase n=1 Tax=Halocynthiibacter halioticoli TaxID=2986804 RepID=A0AAE3J0I7_9RHOB|nr:MULTISPECIES: Gfo/Idh/MocA family oxidoreductase [Halocynthiibacter]MCV6825124.1 Gfo/Idh/MocA family oxidoreductase [Halocynthiibacter halioticoli]MCW4058125.1 Gfo/Idh/MocA family oxidoreductase [Halocynthiibacter sp. SDUM655004]
MTLKFAALGIEHRHIYGMAQNMIDAGADFVGWWNDGPTGVEAGLRKRFPDVPQITNRQDIIDDPEIDLILIADVPNNRAQLAIEAMEAGKDIMADKPGCTTLEQLQKIQSCVAKTGRIWTVDFSERFEVASVTRAAELVADGAIGRVIQTVGLGPHRLNKETRPEWFFDKDAYGGILTDIASHQIDQFLFFTGSTDAEITMANAANYANPETPGLQDFGELSIKSDKGHGYVRVDWYTPDALPNWGDGRLTILGTEGYIELRKYVDLGGKDGIDHLFLVNGTRCERIDCSDAGLPYFKRLVHDIQNRTETAVPQAHTFKVMELGIKAQNLADGQST